MDILSRIAKKSPAKGEMSGRVIVPLIGDTHGGQRHGLLSPETELIDFDHQGNQYTYHPELNKIQIYLDELYNHHIKNVFDLARGDEVMPEHNGDLSQGTKYADDDVMTFNLMIQTAIATANMRRWLKSENVKTMCFAEGTQAHEGLGNSMSYMVAAQLRAEYPDKDVQVVHHGYMDVDGFKIDYAHHGPTPGRRYWLKGNEARYYLRDRMLREIVAGRKPPDLYHRAHYHEPIIEELRVNGYKSILVITPSYSFPGAWTRQATKSLYEVANGMIVLEIENGRLLDIHEYIERTDIRTRQVLHG